MIEDYREILHLNCENEFEEEQNDERSFKRLKKESKSIEEDYKLVDDISMEVDYKSIEYDELKNEKIEYNELKNKKIEYNELKNEKIIELNGSKDKSIELNKSTDDKLIKRSEELYKNESNRSNQTLYLKFKEFKLDRNLLKGLKLIKSIDNKEIIDQHERIYEFLSSKREDNFLIKLSSSGLNLAHLIYCIEKLNSTLNKPQLLIICCSLESANNTLEIVKLLTKFNNKIKSISILGNDQLYSRIEEQIIVGTVGSLMYYLFKMRLIDLYYLKQLVFEEFDILLSSNENISRIQSIVRSAYESKCKMIFLSTCPNSNALSIAKKFTNNNFVTLNLLNIDNYFRNILQFQINTQSRNHKYNYLHKLLSYIDYGKIIVFINGKYFAHQLYNELMTDNFNALVLTSELTVKERLNTVRNFNDDKKVILVVTYPLNINSIFECDLIINYDLNTSYDNFSREYFHNCSHIQDSNHLSNQSKPRFIINFTGYGIERNLLNSFVNDYHLKLYPLLIE